jgi:hypothetical protein
MMTAKIGLLAVALLLVGCGAAQSIDQEPEFGLYGNL